MTYVNVSSKETTINALIKQTTSTVLTKICVKEMSEVIESVLLRIPLTSFYLSRMGGDVPLHVWSGTKKLDALKQFIGGSYALIGLKHLTQLEGMMWPDLSKQIKSQLKNTKVYCHIIEPETDEDMILPIVNLINTFMEYDQSEIEIALLLNDDK